MLIPEPDFVPVPKLTAEIAHAAYPNGNVYITMRDTLGMLYHDSEFASLFAARGRPAESPWRLALVSVMQFAEGLTDRQAADAVRGRIDWKYALSLEIIDPGFNYSVLSEFRDRVLEGGMEKQLLENILQQCQEQGWLKARGKQRTDSTHVLAAIRKVNRLELVGETLRHVLNELANIAPEWVLRQVTPDWFKRYGARFEAYRLPNEKTERAQLQAQIGADGSHLLSAIYTCTSLPWLRELPCVKIMRQVWVQQYYTEDSVVKWRSDKCLPPHKLLITSPYDVEARNRTKRNYNWNGYVVHLTETCDPDTPNLITHVETTPATTADVQVIDDIHTDLARQNLLPQQHIVDTAYVAAEQLVTSQTEHQIDLLGPVHRDTSWQAKAREGFDITGFTIDWETQTVTCPQGHSNQSWHVRQAPHDHTVINVRFKPAECRVCPERAKCTKSKHNRPRVLTLKPQVEYEALSAARARQQTAQFKTQYKKRAGVEGTISQGTRTFNLRRSRYIGLAKTHLQHTLIAAAINLSRAFAWVEHVPRAITRKSSFAALGCAVQLLPAEL
jgi:transposase